MNRILKYLLTLLSVTVLSACSKPDTSDCKVIVIGKVSAFTENTPLEGIRITLMPGGDTKSSEHNTITTYTESHGLFSIHAEGLDRPVECIISAEDPEGVYKSASTILDISLKGPAYDAKKNVFCINDCNFILERKSESE